MLDIQPDSIGIPTKKFNQCIDKYLETGRLNPEIIPYLNRDQMLVINELKKSFARLKRKYGEK